MVGAQAMASWTLPASGGNQTNLYTDAVSVWAAHIFTSGGNFVVDVEELDVEYLIVGGGGGGGAPVNNNTGTAGGGGGAGGLLAGSTNLLEDTYAVVVGEGGDGGVGGTSTTSTALNGKNGQDSTAFGLEAKGGGFGARFADNGGSGGSGGGAGARHGSSSASGGTGEAGPPRQGYNGGSRTQASGSYGAAGGGGASDEGQDTLSSRVNGGAGGDGSSNDITGTNVFYAGGGGGGSTGASATGGLGGSGVGGQGGSDQGNGQAAADNTGGGGGGGAAGSTANGGKGGSGIVVVRYLLGTKQMEVLHDGEPIGTGESDTLPDTGVNRSVSRTYVVTNLSSSAALSLTNSPNAVVFDNGSTNFGGFTITENIEGNATNIVAEGSASFTIGFATNVVGSYTGTISIANSDALQDPYTFDVVVEVIDVPDMQVLFAGAEIPVGATNALPSTLTGQTVSRTFTVTNLTSATADLLLTNSANAVVFENGSTNYGGFSITANIEGDDTEIAPGTSAVFTIGFVTNVVGSYTGTVSIANNDMTKNPYTFKVAIDALATPDMQVLFEDQPIPVGATNALPATVAGVAIERIYTVTNLPSATANLVLTNSPHAVVFENGSTNQNGFTITANIEGGDTNIAAEVSSHFAIGFETNVVGSYTGTVWIANNDTTQNPYTFEVTAIVEPSPDIQVLFAGEEIPVGTTNEMPYTVTDHAVFRTFTVTNLSTATANLVLTNSPNAVVFENGSTNYGGFTIMANIEGSNTTLASGTSAVFTIGFETNVVGVYTGIVSIGNNDITRDPYTFEVTVDVRDAPDMQVIYRNAVISQGATTWLPATVADEPIDRTYSVTNLSTAAGTLLLTNIPHAVVFANGSTNYGGFTITANIEGDDTELDPGKFSDFTIGFETNVVGSYTATVHIASSDLKQDPYVFDVIATCMSWAPTNAAGGSFIYRYLDPQGTLWAVHVFTDGGDFEPLEELDVEYLIVGGGGGGGGSTGAGGGGGAGGLLHNMGGTAITLSPGISNIVVGVGGLGTADGAGTASNGEESYAFGFTALGGGGGGGFASGETTAANAGGSGGGGGASQHPDAPEEQFVFEGGAGESGQGENGGGGNRSATANSQSGGGGGGATVAGGNGNDSRGGDGGDGFDGSLLVGTSIGDNGWFGGGGGGKRGNLSNNYPGRGGAGGGGYSLLRNNIGGAGLANTGGGGGGGSGGNRGGDGGSGVVLVRYPLDTMQMLVMDDDEPIMPWESDTLHMHTFTNQPISRTFVITNLSSELHLLLTNSPHAVVFDENGETSYGGFTITTNIVDGATNIPPNGSESFTLGFVADTLGLHTGTVRIVSNDVTQDPYTFKVVVRVADWAWGNAGGTITAFNDAVGRWMVHIFTETGSHELNILNAGIVEYLVVGGGGAGGRVRGGGGGAGGFLTGTTYLRAGKHTVHVGAGGQGSSGILEAGNGEDSFIGGIVAMGGGRGGRHRDASSLPASVRGQDGGSGGGGGGGSSDQRPKGAGFSGQGRDGGDGGSNSHGGGGGGAGAPGFDNGSSGTGSAGGIGKQSSITGTLTWYAGGGGGMRHVSGASNASGGQGGGGQGASSLDGTNDPTSGADNTGGGGGGANNHESSIGGDGGSGIVVVRYRIPLVFEPTVFRFR